MTRNRDRRHTGGVPATMDGTTMVAGTFGGCKAGASLLAWHSLESTPNRNKNGRQNNLNKIF
jgi:hypothetical protein